LIDDIRTTIISVQKEVDSDSYVSTRKWLTMPLLMFSHEQEISFSVWYCMGYQNNICLHRLNEHPVSILPLSKKFS